MTTISIIIPAYRAQGTLVRAVASVVAQSHAAWQLIVVSDDGFDYQNFLTAQGFSDPRFVFTSTGQVGAGCHRARNAGLPLITGEALTWLDADDAYTPDRLAGLLPLAHTYGAAADRLLCLNAQTGAPLFASDSAHVCATRGLSASPLPDSEAVVTLDLAEFLSLDQPLVPLIMRPFVQERLAGIELAEDVIANIRLLDQLPQIGWWQKPAYHYYIRTDSLAHSDTAGQAFDQAYADYEQRLETGDGFGLSDQARALARQGLMRKRALNQAFCAARQSDPALTFQAFLARQTAP